VAFSAERRQVSGEPFLIAAGSQPSVAHDGTLLYRPASEALARQLAWFTMEGVVGEAIAAPQDWIEGVTLSPDGRRIAASAEDGIWAYDVSTGSRSRLTTGRGDIMPQWVGATGQIVFVRFNAGRSDIVIKRADPGGEERVLVQNGRFPTVTSDGRRLVFNQRVNDSTPWQVAWIDMDRPLEIHRLAGAHLGARFPAVSGDGRLVAYVSGEIGRDEIFMTALPGGKGKWQVSTDGGGWCRFSGPGDAVVYRSLGGSFLSVPITSGDDITLGRPRKLFEWGAAWLPFYELARDGTRGIAAVPVAKTAGVATLSVVQNWHLEFTRTP
jgi:dipeptidyl aminopeptidase/acylaminoacyl peptidase